jgi:hypothetical protein
MDIIDAMAVNGSLQVKKWDETADDDDASMPEEEQYFWRQTFDFANTKTYSVSQNSSTQHATATDKTLRHCEVYALMTHRRIRTN